MSGDSARETVWATASPLGCRCNSMKTLFLPAFASTPGRNADGFGTNAPPLDANALPFAAERYLFCSSPVPVGTKLVFVCGAAVPARSKVIPFGATDYLFTCLEQTGTCLRRKSPFFTRTFPFPRNTQTNAANSYYGQSHSRDIRPSKQDVAATLLCLAQRSYRVLLRRRPMNKNALNNDDPDRSDISVAGSGTAAAAPENENSPFADRSCVVKLNVAGVGSKPFPEIVPVPSTNTEFAVWPPAGTADEARSKVNPSTDQKLGIDPELNDHGAWNSRSSPGVTNVAKFPSTLST